MASTAQQIILLSGLVLCRGAPLRVVHQGGSPAEQPTTGISGQVDVVADRIGLSEVILSHQEESKRLHHVTTDTSKESPYPLDPQALPSSADPHDAQWRFISTTSHSPTSRAKRKPVNIVRVISRKDFVPPPRLPDEELPLLPIRAAVLIKVPSRPCGRGTKFVRNRCRPVW